MKEKKKPDRLDLEIDEQVWLQEHEDVCREASGYDVTIYSSHAPESGKRHCCLSIGGMDLEFWTNASLV